MVLRVTFRSTTEALSFLTGDLAADAASDVIAACTRLAHEAGWTVRVERLPSTTR